MQKKTIGLWVPLIILALTLPLNYFYGQALYIYGETLIVNAQKYDSYMVKSIFVFFTFLIEPYLVVTVLFTGLTLHRKKFQATVMAIAILFNIYVFMVMKAFFIEPRPFWTRKQIHCYGYYCPRDYGSPSGHTEFAVFIFLIFVVHFNKQRKLWPTILSLGTVFMIMISRMYLGGHSLDQVIFGFIVAACVVLIYDCGGLRKKISLLLLNFHKRQTKATVLKIILALYLTAMSVYFVNQLRQQGFKQLFKIWKTNFTQKCPTKIDYGRLNEAAFIAESAIVCFIYGSFFAFSDVRKQHKSFSFLLGKWTYNGQKYGMKSFMIIIALGVSFIVAPLIISYPFLYVFQNFWLDLITINLAAFFAPRFHLNFVFKFSKYISLVQIQEQIKKEISEQFEKFKYN